MKTITWKTIKSFARQAFAPVGEPEPPDHPAQWVLRDGVPDLCCDKHAFHQRDRHLLKTLGRA